MIAFKSIQGTVKTLIENHAYFAAETILEDLGLTDPQRNQALEDRGACVTVWPILRGVTTSQTQGAAVVDVAIPVLLEINPEQNDQVAQLDIYEALQAIKAAVLSYAPTNPKDNFSLSGEPLEFSDHDPGLLSYILTFIKRTVF